MVVNSARMLVSRRHDQHRVGEATGSHHRSNMAASKTTMDIKKATATTTIMEATAKTTEDSSRIPDTAGVRHHHKIPMAEAVGHHLLAVDPEAVADHRQVMDEVGNIHLGEEEEEAWARGPGEAADGQTSMGHPPIMVVRADIEPFHISLLTAFLQAGVDHR